MINAKNIDTILKESAVEAVNAISYEKSGIDFSLGANGRPVTAANNENDLACVALEIETPVKLIFSLRSTRGLIIAITAAALEMSEDEIGTEEYMDTAAEILNVAAGACSKRILTQNLPLKLGLPRKNVVLNESGLSLLTNCSFIKNELDYIIFSVYAPE
jgi:hypothetical protein